MSEQPRWPAPDRTKVLGDEAVTLVPLDWVAHGVPLWKAASPETNGGDVFQYMMGSGPFSNQADYLAHLRRVAAAPDLAYTVIRSLGNEVVGSASLLNIRPEHGAVEVGSIWYTKKAQRTEVNTHAMFSLFSYVFDELGYRRLEWKCNNENEPSKAAALRLGFQYEGLFRQHVWVKGRNRDTAWYSIVDGEWPAVKQRFLEALLR